MVTSPWQRPRYDGVNWSCRYVWISEWLFNLLACWRDGELSVAAVAAATCLAPRSCFCKWALVRILLLHAGSYETRSEAKRYPISIRIASLPLSFFSFGVSTIGKTEHNQI